MVMTWTSLVAPKGTAGSIASSVNYSKLDPETIVDEAQSLLFQVLRVREMRKEWVFGMAVGQAQIDLPSRFLDPIGRLYDVTNTGWISHTIESEVFSARAYQAAAGTFGNNPFTTIIGSSNFSVAKVAHGLNQGSTVTIAGVTDPSFAGLNGQTLPLTSIVNANTLLLGGDDVSAVAVTGGGAGATYTANNLIAGYPSRWSVWDEQAKFDTAFDTATQFKLLYYRAPLPLSSSNNSNWLTTRYPMLMRKACQAAAADFMKDDTEYQKCLGALQALIQSTAAADDLIYRGAEFGTDTP